MATGQVKWFNRAKGFGFITQGGQEDIFVHYSQIEENDDDALHQGDAVEFELRRGPRGLHATNVSRVNSVKNRRRHHESR